MGKKDKKPKTAEQKARVAAKQTKKAVQKEKKLKSKGAEDSEGEDVDLELVLEEYAKQVRRMINFKLHEEFHESRTFFFPLVFHSRYIFGRSNVSKSALIYLALRTLLKRARSLLASSISESD